VEYMCGQGIVQTWVEYQYGMMVLSLPDLTDNSGATAVACGGDRPPGDAACAGGWGFCDGSSYPRIGGKPSLEVVTRGLAAQRVSR